MKIELLRDLQVGKKGAVISVDNDLANYLIKVKGAKAVVDKIDKTEGAEPKQAIKKNKPTKVASKSKKK
ncbi:MAG: hypothetical protein PHU69_14015 [Fermentimonas sp.]|nr:hypothetical protein [Fermentimonas sp.]